MKPTSKTLFNLTLLAISLTLSLATASAQSAPAALDPNGVSAAFDPSSGNLCVTANLVPVGIDGSDLTSTGQTIDVTDTAGNFVEFMFGTVGFDTAVSGCAPFSPDCSNMSVVLAAGNDWGLGASITVGVASPDGFCASMSGTPSGNGAANTDPGPTSQAPPSDQVPSSDQTIVIDSVPSQ